MNRRGFLGALVTLVAAPRLLAKLAPARLPTLDELGGTSLHGLCATTVPNWQSGYMSSLDFPYQHVTIRRPCRRAESFPAWERRVLG
jgi:hypothetical protein